MAILRIILKNVIYSLFRNIGPFYTEEVLYTKYMGYEFHLGSGINWRPNRYSNIDILRMEHLCLKDISLFLF